MFDSNRGCRDPCVGVSPNSPETYTRLSVSLGGYYYAGNLNQVQSNLQLHLGISSPTLGTDVQVNGYRLWSETQPDEEYELVGDDLFVTALPFWYFSSRFYLAGVGRYESSKLQRVDHRYAGGLGLGYAPVRSRDWLMRIALVPAYEHSTFPGDDFRIDVDHDGPSRQVFRAAVLSNGWYRVKESPLSFRYALQLWPNPLDMSDFRVNLNTNMDVKIVGPLAFRFSLLWTYDPSILRGREPYDVRSTFGIAYTTK